MKFSFESGKKILKNTALGVTTTLLSIGAIQAKEKPVLEKNTSAKHEITTDPAELRLLQKIDILEKKFNPNGDKEVHDGKKAYVFITESNLANNADYNLNITKLESIFKEDFENDFINDQNRDYYVLDRSLNNLQGLAQEYEIDQRNDNKDFVMKKHITPTDYVIFKLEPGDLSYEYKGTFTIVDMKTKKITKHTFTISSDETFKKAQKIREEYKNKGYNDESIKTIQDLKLNDFDSISKQITEELHKII
jgi:hypothetical protein